MKRSPLVLALSIFPLFYLAMFGLLMVSVMSGAVEVDTMTSHSAIRATHISAVALTCVSIAYFSVHVLRNRTVRAGAKVVWLAAFLFATIAALPFYYWKMIHGADTTH